MYSDPHNKGFTLLEIICSLGILSIICSSAVVIMARNKESSYNVTMQLRALEVARENMEQILVLDTVKEMTQYSESERYPAIEWESNIETFDSPLEGQTWARAKCIARYKDLDDNEQSVELEHWLCKVSAEDMEDLDQLQQGESLLLETITDAADFMGVPEQEILIWIENGMVQTLEGYFIQANLELYARTHGEPSPEERDMQDTSGVFADQFDQETGDEDLYESEPDIKDLGGRR